jgi:hypothetical protein
MYLFCTPGLGGRTTTVVAMKLSNRMKSLALAVGVSAICLAVTYLFYPRIVFELYGKDMPQAWASDLGGMSFSQMYQKLGAPQEDASAKDYQQWVEVHWWGKKILKVISVDCCKPASKPSVVIYVVYVDGWYQPVYQKTLAKSGGD